MHDEEGSGELDAWAERRLNAEPSLILIITVIAFVFAVSIFGSRYTVDLNTLSAPWRHIAGVAAAVFTFLAMSTLTTMAYCFLFHRDTDVVRRFAATVGNFATIGAILGTLLGLRLVVPFGLDLLHHRKDPEQPFMEYISLAGSTATIVTLVMISFCWVRSLGVIILTVRRNLGTADTKSGMVTHARVALPVLIVLYVNWKAVDAAFAMAFIFFGT